MKIRPVVLDDFSELYEIGKNTPELRVSSTEDFMDADEFRWSLTNPHGVFLVAENKRKKIGFIYANSRDTERPFDKKYACLVYLVVIPEFRRQGVAQQLYSECEKRLKQLEISNIYMWANAETNGNIIESMKRRGFGEGHKYIWMDKKIS